MPDDPILFPRLRRKMLVNQSIRAMDSKSVTFNLKQVAKASFQWEPYGYNQPAIIPCDANGNEKTEFVAGEDVYILFAIKNTGDGSGNALIEGVDSQGVTVFSAGTSTMSPGQVFKSSYPSKLMDPMPNRDWVVTFTVTP